MLDFITQNYLSLKAVHLVAVISWMAGLLYLPRLFVYHADVAVGSEASELFKVMERRLARYIMLPALGLSTLLGGGLMCIPGVLAAPNYWFHGKVALVVLLFAFHGFLIKCLKAYERDERPYGARFFRIINEVPTLLMIGIVFFVVLKPF